MLKLVRRETRTPAGQRPDPSIPGSPPTQRRIAAMLALLALAVLLAHLVSLLAG